VTEHRHEGTRDKHAVHRQLIVRLREQADDVRRLTSDLSEDQMRRRTVPEKWSVHELVCHLWRIQNVFQGRLDAMIEADTPAIASYNPDNDPEFGRMVEETPAAAVANFLAARERFVDALEPLTPSAWHRRGAHPEFPNFDVHFLVEYFAHHEAHHLYQMFQRRIPFGKVPH
jgi:uncharacterized protein (TIGR03083 family)